MANIIRTDSVSHSFFKADTPRGQVAVILEFYEESGEQRCMGEVFFEHGGREYTGSLERLHQMHTLEDSDTGEEVGFDAAFVARVMAWAYGEGY